MIHNADWQLIHKYDRPGPRYTSYPTAPLFSESIGPEALLAYLAETVQNRSPLSLYVHVPFCHKLCWYCGCNMRVSRNREHMKQHLGLIKKEMTQLRGLVHRDRQACQIHFGGGTPNYLDKEDLMDLVFFLRQQYPLTQDAEVSVELDPRHLTSEQASAFKFAGFNRVSLGVQDFNPEVQKAINRVQPFDLVAAGVDWLREAGFESINMDLIYGLPLQTPDSFERTVNDVISLHPDRVALFNYAYVPSLKPHMGLIQPEDLPQPINKFQMLANTVNQLLDAGYVYIGMDHFAKPNDPMALAMATGDLHRNFQGYTTHTDTEMLAFGMSAISMFDQLYVQNVSDVSAYEEAIGLGGLATCRGYRLNQDDRLRRKMISDFMCQHTIEPAVFEHRSGFEFDGYFPGVRESLNQMVDDGLLENIATGWKATFLGRLLMRNVAMLFDTYLTGLIEQKKASFSRTV